MPRINTSQRENISEAAVKKLDGLYCRYIKRIIDFVLSSAAIVVLIPVWIILAVAIKIDDPGPVFFRQKRICRDENGETKYFNIYKYRSMKMSTPHDVPTHLLERPEQYITRVGKILRKTSLDELPQIFNIWKGEMSIIGPRPALWNQYDLYDERAKRGANLVLPGLTGWAQINGRDELEIEVKAGLDGEYVENLSFAFDVKCFFGTIISVLKSDGVVEGGTGEIKKKNENSETQKIAVVSSHTHSLFWFRMDMMKEFAEKGFDVVAFGQEDEDAWRDRFAENNVRYRKIPINRNGLNPLSDVKSLLALNKALKEEKPSKIFCYQAKSIIYTCIAARMNRISEVYPLVAGLGSIFRGDSFKSKLVKAIMVFEYKIALKNSKCVMFQNKDDMNAFTEAGIISESKCRIINGSGVDIRKFRVTEQPDETAFLMTSRLIRDKGVMEYLDACRALKKENPNVRFLLVGPYDTNPSAIKPEELKEYIDDSSVEYFGEQEDVRPFLEQASVFVLPSYHEGTPKTVLEAMACGRAVITTDAPGCRETVTDSENGVLVPVKDVQALAEAMRFFIDNPEKAVEMGAEGRKKAESKYDVNLVNTSIMKIMEINF